MRSTQQTLLVLDIGTSSTRALVFDERARPLPGIVAQVAYDPDIAATGDMTYAADRLFEAVVEAVDQVVRQLSVADRQVTAVAGCTFVTSILGIDAQDQPATPVLTYAAPGCAGAVETLRLALGGAGVQAVHERTGCVLHSSYLPARFVWMAAEHPQWLERSVRWMSIGDYVLWRLTGDLCTSYSVASWTGLLNRHTLQWDETWLARLPIAASQLSPLVDVAPRPGRLRPAWRKRWPALASAQWLPAVGDGAGANVGSGAGDGEHIALTIGTTGALRVVVPAALPVVPDGLWLYRVTATEGLLGGATTEGGNLLAWLRTTLNLPRLDELETLWAQRTPGAHGLQMLPFIAGERAPGWRDNAQAVLQGFTLATTPLDIYQAALEAIAYRFALIHRRLAPLLSEGGKSSTVVASGGALAGSRAWQQIIADALGRPLLVTQETELSARGAALLALRALGQITALSDLPPAPAAVMQPDAARHAFHQAALEQQVILYQQLVK
ncbi:MAG: carbohydrate kinase [Caldilineaceae bacterium]|nr:carbohydrate kinase [Caldilineaceae bacterium]